MLFLFFSALQPADAVFPTSYGEPEDCEQAECDFYVEWRNNDRFVDFRMEGNAIGWIALGLSSENTPLDMVRRCNVLRLLDNTYLCFQSSTTEKLKPL